MLFINALSRGTGSPQFFIFFRGENYERLGKPKRVDILLKPGITIIRAGHALKVHKTSGDLYFICTGMTRLGAPRVKGKQIRPAYAFSGTELMIDAHDLKRKFAACERIPYRRDLFMDKRVRSVPAETKAPAEPKAATTDGLTELRRAIATVNEHAERADVVLEVDGNRLKAKVVTSI